MMKSIPLPAAIRILLIEENEVEALLIGTALHGTAFNVERASSLAAAVTTLRSSAFDVILCELNLPDSAGLETLDALLERAEGIPIVVITGRENEATALRAVAGGAQDYLFKGSTDQSALVRAVRYAVERGRATESLIRSEARMRALFEGALDAMVTIRTDGCITRWNRSAEEIFGWTRAEALGRSMQELIIPERFREEHLRGIARFIDSGKLPLLGRRVEWLALRRDGSEFPVEVRITAETDEEGATFTAFIADITDRVRAEQNRHASDMKFRATVDHLHRQYESILNSMWDGVHGLDLAGNVIFENPAAALMLGWAPAELLGRSAHPLVHHSDADGKPLPKETCPIHAPRGDHTVRCTSDDVFWRKDGTPVRVEYTAAPMLDERGEVTGTVVTFRDVAKHRQMEQQLEQTSRVASLGRVSASVAHEFNNLLMGVSPFAEVLQHRSRGDAGMTTLATHILDVVRRGQRLTDEILRFTSPPVPQLEMLDLSSWLQKIGEEARGIVGPRKVTTEIGEPLRIHADRDQLSQVVLNLVKNARDATPVGGAVTLGAARAEIVPFLRPRLPAPDRLMTLFVRDNGSGIAANVVERIFEPLFTTRKGGHGIGLALAWQIIAQHGGQILIDTQPGAGSTFHLVLRQA